MKGGGKACQRQNFKSRTWQSFDFHFSEDLLLDRKKQLEVVRMGRRGAFEVLHVLWGIKNNCPCLKDWLFTVTEMQRWKQFNAHLSCCVCVRASHFSCVQLLVTSWTVALQTPLSMGFFEPQYWSGLPYPSLADLPDSGIKSASLTSPGLAGGLFTTSATICQPPRSISKACCCSSVPKSCPTLCEPMGSSAPGSSVLPKVL